MDGVRSVVRRCRRVVIDMGTAPIDFQRRLRLGSAAPPASGHDAALGSSAARRQPPEGVLKKPTGWKR
jgi:hypothetical protein